MSLVDIYLRLSRYLNTNHSSLKTSNYLKQTTLEYKMLDRIYFLSNLLNFLGDIRSMSLFIRSKTRHLLFPKDEDGLSLPALNYVYFRNQYFN